MTIAIILLFVGLILWVGGASTENGAMSFFGSFLTAFMALTLIFSLFGIGILA
jgi:hypothetical protein